MALTIVVGCSVVLQLCTAFQAIRLIRLTGRHLAWICIAAGMIFMTLRRLLSLYASLSGAPIIFPDPVNEYVGLCISALLFFGVVKIAPLFSSIRNNELELRETHQELSAVIQNSPAAIIVTDTPGNVELWNKEAERIFGWKEEEVLHRQNPIVPAEHIEEWRAVRRRVLGGETIRYDEAMRRRKDGALIPVELSAAQLRDARGEPRGVLAIVGDRSDRRKIEDTLRQSEDHFSKVLSASSIGISVSRLKDGLFINVNEAYLAMYGYERAEMIGRTSGELNLLVAPDARKRIVELLRGEGKTRDMELLVRRKSGETREVLFSAEAIDVGGEECLLGLTLDITEQKRAADALRTSEERFRKYFEMGLFGMAITSPTKRVLEVNAELCRILGYTREELLRMEWGGLTHPDDRDAANEKFNAVLERRIDSYSLEKRVVRKDGRAVDVAMSVNSVRSPDGELEHFVALFQDISERKRAGEELEKLRNAVDASGEVVFTTDRAGAFTFVNPAFTELYGFSADEVIGRATPRILKGGGVEPGAYKQFWDQLLAGNRLLTEMVNVTREARQVTVESSVSPVFNDRGEITGFLAIQKDVTQRKRMEAELEESADRFRQLTENIREAFWLRDAKKNEMLYVSPAYEAIWGQSVATLLASPSAWADAVHPDDRERVLASARTNQVLGTYDEEFRIMRPSGEIRWVRARAFPVKGAASEVIRIAGVSEDITERKQAEAVREGLEEQLQQAQRLESLGTLASGIAHDFNNILAIILGHATLLGSIKSDPDRFAKALGTLQQACQRGTSLVRQLLMFARKTGSILEPLLVGDMITDIAKLLMETFPKNVRIETRVADDLPAVLADATQVHQVLLNLCVNARDAMPEGGVLTIEAALLSHASVVYLHPEASAKEFVRVRVTDTGSGMDEETKRRIFEPFFTTKGPGKGTGLGLALVYSISKNHRGWVDVESAPGKGTAISVFIPAPERRVEPGRVPDVQGELVAGGNETVLLIEDEEMLTELVRSILDEKGYRVIVAVDGVEGVAAFREHGRGIDLVVTDIGLPKIGGEEVFRQIRTIDPSASVIIVSGFLEPEKKSALEAGGAAGFIQKPYMPAELLKAVREALDARPRDKK